MIKNLLVLQGGTELSSGDTTGNAIKSVTLQQCVNSDEELTLGSVCANMLEVTLITPNGGLSLHAGEDVTLCKVDDEGTRHQVGVFILEKPTRPTAHTMKLTGYDRVTKLDKDLTVWLKELDTWPYNVLDFAEMVCDACGLTFNRSEVPKNSDYSVTPFAKTGVTGRQLMKWIGEVCCCFFRANAAGEIEPGWYEALDTHAIGYKEGAIFRVYDDDAGNLVMEGIDVHSSTDDAGNVSITSDRLTVEDDGEGNVVLTVEDLTTLTYFQNGLSYEDYEVAPVEAVQIQLAEGDSAYRYPKAVEGANCYIISGNPLLNSITEAVDKALENICDRLATVTYTPCKVSLPAALDIQPGHIVRIVDRNKKSINMLVMSKKTTGQRDTYECTGSHRRDSTVVQNNQSASAVAQQKVDAQTQEEIFKKLTNGNETQGVYLKDGILYIDAGFIKSGKVAADYIDVENLTVDAAKITGTLDANVVKITNLTVDAVQITGTLSGECVDGSNLTIKSGATIAGWNIDSNSIYKKADPDNSWSSSTFMCTGSEGSYSIGGSDKISGWVFGAGGKFGVTSAGAVWCSDIHATGGTIGGWTISGSELSGIATSGHTVQISPIGVFGYFKDADGTYATGTVSWQKILSSAMAWGG